MLEFDTPAEALEHYGVKGMKWGRHKSVPKISRRENRRMNKEASDKFYNDKALTLLEESMKKKNKIFIKTVTPGDPYGTVMTGSEFVSYLSRGGALNIKASDIYAEIRKDGKAPQMIGTYQKQNFRKNPPPIKK